MAIDVDLLFHPVGQGLFASGHIKRRGSNQANFSWIYDCGSLSGGHLEIGGINRLAAHMGGSRPPIDLLVISHFDHDHISGIPHLLTTFDVKQILLPLVPLWSRLSVIARLGHSVTALEQALILDPVGTLSGLPEGVSPDEIVIVPAQDGSEGPPALDPRETPEDHDFTLHIDRNDLEENSAGSFGYSLSDNDSSVQVSMLKKSGRLAVGNVWEFVPYNDALSIGKASPKFVQDAEILANFLYAAPSERARSQILSLTKLHYEAHFKGSQARNQLSLFLYGGASPKLRRTGAAFNGWRNLYPSNCPKEDLRGVLYTGDGTLRTAKAWKQLHTFFGSQRLSQLTAIQVMHHGSRYNWRAGLAGKIAAETAIFAADPNFRHRHPHGEVWDDFAASSTAILVDTRFPCHLTQRFA